MGRPSKLTEQQRTEIKRRLLDGEKPADLAREFKVSKALVSGLNKRVEELKGVANQVVSAERALGNLPVPEQLLTVSLAGKLRSISDSLASAAELGARTAHRLHALANSEVGKVDDADPLSQDSITSLKNVGVLTKLGNDSANIAINLLAANRDTVKRITEDEPEKPEELTPERIAEGVRRIAFTLHKAAATEN
jgi:hypothetical protein